MSFWFKRKFGIMILRRIFCDICFTSDFMLFIISDVIACTLLLFFGSSCVLLAFYLLSVNFKTSMTDVISSRMPDCSRLIRVYVYL